MAVTSPAPRVMIVEDEANIRELVRFHLSHEGYACDPIADGQTALKRAEAERFDLMVIDLMLPGLDGLSLCRAVRNGALNHDVPILMLTARCSRPGARSRTRSWASRAGPTTT